MGAAVEIDNSYETGTWDYFGLTLSAILIYSGGCLFYYGIRSKIGKKKE
jgi:hypothetical protein